MTPEEIAVAHNEWAEAVYVDPNEQEDPVNKHESMYSIQWTEGDLYGKFPVRHSIDTPSFETMISIRTAITRLPDSSNVKVFLTLSDGHRITL